MEKENKLLLVATFRHYFIALGLALSDKRYNYHLIFINQKFNDEKNPVYQVSKKIIKPFSSVSIMPLRVSDFKQKNINRKETFEILKDKISSLRPVEIATGNDRRIEYQFSINWARNKLKIPVKGAYLDNGTGSYISFQKLDMGKYLARKWLDVPVKKAVYGNWFSRMQRFGGSKWTDICYLTHPEFAPARLKKKECVEVEMDFYQSDEARKLILQIIAELGELPSLEGGSDSILLVLPRGTVIEDMYGSLANAESLFKDIASNFGRIYLKYHPADQEDILNFGERAEILPSAVPIEILFSVLKFSRVIGDTSTAILSAKWMNPEAEVQYFDIDNKYVDIVRPLFESIGIKPLKV